MEHLRLLGARLRVLYFGTCLLLFVIVLRLIYLQIYLNDLFFSKAQKNFLRIEHVSAPRGNIIDENGVLLATNRPITYLMWQGTGKKNFDDDQITTLTALATIFNVPFLENAELLTAEKRNQSYTLMRSLTFDQLSKVIEQFPHHPNLKLITHYERYYPHNTIASHILGYLGGIDLEITGKMGLEKLYEESLKGIPGKRLKKINSRGHQLAQEEINRALAGHTLHTTINFSLQKIVEELFPLDFAGTVIIMDPKNGGIQALISRPHFDPNIFLNPLDAQTWAELQINNPFLNRACNACYPPASLFKLITFAAALETRLITPEQTWYCCGYTTFAGRQYHCHCHEGHGALNTREALAKSCNIPPFEIGKRIKIDTLADYAHRFGLGKSTNSPFPEKQGIVPSTRWKRLVKHEAWWAGETLSAAIGQSFTLVTPIQIACMISAIGEGYLVTPRILIDQPIEKRPLEISELTRNFLKKSMQSVIAQGTGQTLNRLHDMVIYAKTGTAQTSSLEKRDHGKQYQEHAWFVAYIHYKNYAPMTLVILIEHARSSSVATALAKKILMRYCKEVSQ